MSLPSVADVLRAEDLNAPRPTPSAWIQWKGTNVCMDLHCVCGEHSHIDEWFVYFVRCWKCKAVYHLESHPKLTQVQEPKSWRDVPRPEPKETHGDHA